ncbi:MAG: OsmC family protein, partial [Nitratireductor sp.]|nr:OsmC family protein [Nitratireductor sp.]
AALASCLTGGLAAVAQHRGIQLHSARAIVEGDIDVRGILGMDPDIRNGFSAIRVTFEINADASEEDIRALVAQSQKRSAVFDILTNPTNVSVDLA